MSAEPSLARELTATQLARYSRHLTLPGVGITGQNRIANAKVLIIGAGGLGSPIASYLIAAGVKQLSVIDPDSVELSNLQRQILHREKDQGALKVASVQRLAVELNSEVAVHCHATYLAPENAVELFAEHDVVIDGSDNFATRYLSSDAAEITGTPLVWEQFSNLRVRSRYLIRNPVRCCAISSLRCQRLIRYRPVPKVGYLVRCAGWSDR